MHLTSNCAKYQLTDAATCGKDRLTCRIKKSQRTSRKIKIAREWRMQNEFCPQLSVTHLSQRFQLNSQGYKSTLTLPRGEFSYSWALCPTCISLTTCERRVDVNFPHLLWNSLISIISEFRANESHGCLCLLFHFHRSEF